MKRPMMSGMVIACVLAIGGFTFAQVRKDAPGASKAPSANAAVGLEPTRTQELDDLENLARTKSDLFRTRLNAIIADVLKSPEIAALQQEANAIATRANDALVKACGKSTADTAYNFDTRRCVDKPKETAERK